MSSEVDSRALDNTEIKDFMEGGNLYSFVKLVKEHEELELCFRGNGRPKYISIYYNKLQAFKVDLEGVVEISYRTARYWKDCKREYKELVNAGFRRCKTHIGKPEEESFETFVDKKTLSLYNKIDNVIDKFKSIEELYVNIVRPMLENYANNIEQYDYFKEGPGTSHPRCEFKAQHKLFDELRETKSGYFLYDLEFHQKGDGNANEPDMLGLKFDNDGKPEKLVFVEVKSTKSALKDTGNNKKGSGLKGHIEKTIEYIKDERLINNRKDEAYSIMRNYATLNLRGLNERTSFDEHNFKKLDLETLFVFTDEAKKKLENGSEFDWFKNAENKVELNTKDMECLAYGFNKEQLSGLIK